MKVTVIGTGYVGLITGILLSEVGHQVICLDVESAKITLLSKGIPTIHENNLEPLLKKNLERKTLSFTTDAEKAFDNVEVIFIAVGTPQGEDGRANLVHIEQAAKDIGNYIDHDVTVVVKSTVPPGTNDQIEQLIRQYLTHPVTVHVVSNPEFLREGHAIHDAFHGDRIVIGSEREEAGQLVESLYSSLPMPVIRTDRRSAEMIKYAANAFLAVKISFINEIANLCTEIGADVEAVADGMGLDQRIGRAFLNAGIGYGGSCFPKDTEALAYVARQSGASASIVESAIKTNHAQRHLFVNRIVQHFNGDIAYKKIAILGLAFKPNTDDIREAPSITIIEQLKNRGAQISAYDPVVTNQFSAQSLMACINQADAIVLVTEWTQFLEADWLEIGSRVKDKVIFDGRNALAADRLLQEGWTYIGVGKERKQVYGFQKN